MLIIPNGTSQHTYIRKKFIEEETKFTRNKLNPDYATNAQRKTQVVVRERK
jgi:hypothetical protein